MGKILDAKKDIKNYLTTCGEQKVSFGQIEQLLLAKFFPLNIRSIVWDLIRERILVLNSDSTVSLKKPTKILATSDLHGNFPDLREIDTDCELLLIAGDILRGPPNLQHVCWQKFLNWCKLWTEKGVEVIAIPGNHDWHIYNNIKRNLYSPFVTLLIDSGTQFKDIKIYGSPWQPVFHNWAYNATEDRLKVYFDVIPDDTDILLLHGPPNGCLDRNAKGERVGSVAAKNAILEKQPDIAIFGHIHESFGEDAIGKTKCYNVSYVDEYYQPKNNFVEILYEK